MIETAPGLRARPDDGLRDVAAAAAGGLVVVADGMGGHGTGWLGLDATLVARVRAHATRPLTALARALAELDAPTRDIAFVLARRR